MTTGLALPVAGAMAAVYATNPTIAEVGLAAAATSIFVDGTVSPFLTDVEDPPGERLANSFGGPGKGRYDRGDNNQFVIYPGTLGILSVLSSGLGADTFDESESKAVEGLYESVRANQTSEDAPDHIYIVGYSQGASAVVRAVKKLENTEEFDYDPAKVTVVLAANPRRNDGGLLTRFPAFTLPLVGATFGEGTTSGETKIIQVTKQYDGVADAPVYFLNPIADANAILGFVYLHGGYYQDVDIDPEAIDAVVNDENVETVPPSGVIVTTDGNVTDILIENERGNLPLTQPLRSIGVPDEVIWALDPLLRAVIETAYDRPEPGDEFPSEPVRFKLLPGPDQWAGDAQSVAAGAVQTVKDLGSLASPSTTLRDADTTPAPAIAVADPDLNAKTTVKPVSPKKSWRINRVDPKSKIDSNEKASSTGHYRPGDGLRSVSRTVQKSLSSFGPDRKKPETRTGGPRRMSPIRRGADNNTSDSGSGTKSSSAPAS